VHAYGSIRLIGDEGWLLRLLRHLTDRHEAGREPRWRIEDLPAAYLAQMLRGIIGFEITVARLEGKYKLSQNRPASDRPRVIAALESQGDPDAIAIARLMQEREPE
jgi:transcriptional regulator